MLELLSKSRRFRRGLRPSAACSRSGSSQRRILDSHPPHSPSRQRARYQSRRKDHWPVAVPIEERARRRSQL